MMADWRQRLEAEFEAGQAYKPNKADWLDGKWAGLTSTKESDDDPRRGQTGIETRAPEGDRLRHLKVPDGFKSTSPSSASSITVAR